MKLYRVKGDSMFPFIKEGDYVLVKKLSDENYKIGNVVIFRRNTGERIVHRVVKRDRKEFVYIKGDKYSLCERIKLSNIEGKVMGIIRSQKFILINPTEEWFFWVVSWFEKFLFRVKRKLSLIMGVFKPNAEGA